MMAKVQRYFLFAVLGAACLAFACSGPEPPEVRRVRIGSTETIMELHYEDGDAIHDVSWLEERRQAQLATADAFGWLRKKALFGIDLARGARAISASPRCQGRTAPAGIGLQAIRIAGSAKV